ncbi:MAG: FG-GAP repeat protein, partial [Trueperaceae bacterium]
PGGVVDAGSAYLFNGTTGAVLLSIPNPAPLLSDSFGWSVAGVGGNILVGAHYDDPGGVFEAGSAYLFCEDGDDDQLCNQQDNCPAVSNPPQTDTDGDAMGDACDSDDDNDLVSDVAEPACEGAPLNASVRPERIDPPFAGIDDDGDTQVDEPLPLGAETYDCDGDGYNGAAENGAPLCGNGVNDDENVASGSDDGLVDDGCPGGPAQVGTYSEAQFNIGITDQDPCGADWAADLVPLDPVSYNRLNVLDLSTYVSLVRRLNMRPGDSGFDARWDVVPGPAAPGGFWIDVLDLTQIVQLAPPMLGGVRAFQGPDCPWPP